MGESHGKVGAMRLKTYNFWKDNKHIKGDNGFFPVIAVSFRSGLFWVAFMGLGIGISLTKGGE